MGFWGPVIIETHPKDQKMISSAHHTAPPMAHVRIGAIFDSMAEVEVAYLNETFPPHYHDLSSGGIPTPLASYVAMP